MQSLRLIVDEATLHVRSTVAVHVHAPLSVRISSHPIKTSKPRARSQAMMFDGNIDLIIGCLCKRTRTSMLSLDSEAIRACMLRCPFMLLRPAFVEI